MIKPSYDTREGIELALKDGLDGLRRLSAERLKAGYDRRERLDWWLVLSHYVFDTCGNTSVITEGGPTYYNFDASPPRVMSREEFDQAKYPIELTSTFGSIPPTDDVCPRCLSGWDMHNFHNYKWNGYGDKKHYHKDCYRLMQTQEETEFFKEILDQAVYYTHLKLIPNGYSRDSARPWFIVETTVGPIKIGYRKRVISIHWDKAEGLQDVDGTVLFADQDTTKDSKLVHAWGKEKAVEYLRKLMPHALDQMQKAAT